MLLIFLLLPYFGGNLKFQCFVKKIKKVYYIEQQKTSLTWNQKQYLYTQLKSLKADFVRLLKK